MRKIYKCNGCPHKCTLELEDGCEPETCTLDRCNAEWQFIDNAKEPTVQADVSQPPCAVCGAKYNTGKYCSICGVKLHTA